MNTTANRAKVIRLIAEVVSGLQVPLSLGVPLGTAREPYVKLRNEVDIFGYPDADECEQKLLKILS